MTARQSTAALHENPLGSAWRWGVLLAILILVVGAALTLVVGAHASEPYLAQHPLRAGWMVAFSGLLVAAAMALTLKLWRRKQSELEQMVEVRTVQLRESENKFRQLVELFPETIFDADAAGNIFYVNPHGLAQFRASTEVLEGRPNILQFVHEPDQPAVIERMRARHEGMTGGYLEYRARRVDGSLFDAMAYTTPVLGLHGIIGIRGFILDITTRKKAEEQLRESHGLQQQLLENIDAGVLIIDPESHTIQQVNKKALELFGGSEDQVLQ